MVYSIVFSVLQLVFKHLKIFSVDVLQYLKLQCNFSLIFICLSCKAIAIVFIMS